MMTDKLIEEIATAIAKCDHVDFHLMHNEIEKMKYEKYAAAALRKIDQCRDRMRWVPVSEHEFEPNRFYNCVDKNGQQFTGQCFVFSGETVIAFRDMEIDANEVALVMPLPQPPQQEQQEQSE